MLASTVFLRALLVADGCPSFCSPEDDELPPPLLESRTIKDIKQSPHPINNELLFSNIIHGFNIEIVGYKELRAPVGLSM